MCNLSTCSHKLQSYCWHWHGNIKTRWNGLVISLKHRKMNPLVVTILVIGILYEGAMGIDDEMAEMMKMLRDSCVEETGVDVALIDKVNSGGDLMPDDKLKCYCKCYMETAGMFSNGIVEVETILAMLPDDLRSKNEGSIRKCGTQKGADDCETAYLTQVCWQTSNKADYFLV